MSDARTVLNVGAGAGSYEPARAGISVFHRLPAPEVAAASERLGRDLESGAWEADHAELLAQTELDVGLRLVVWELA